MAECIAIKCITSSVQIDLPQSIETEHDVLDTFQVLMGNTYSGTAIDVWSAGVTLYTLCAGQFPVRLALSSAPHLVACCTYCRRCLQLENLLLLAACFGSTG